MSAFAPRAFFRQASNQMLARYFKSKGLLADVDFGSLRETEVEPIFEVYQRLSEADRTAVDADLRAAHTLGTENGELTLIEEGRFHQIELQDRFAELDNFHDRALFALLEHSAVFEVALLFIEADSRPRRYWRLAKGVPAVDPRDSAEDAERLGRTLGAYLRRTEGRGEPCTVEVYRRGNRHYFFAYPEDFGTTQGEYVRGKFERRRVSLTFDIVFVYSKDEGACDVYFPGSYKRVPDLRQIFFREILGLDHDPALDDDRVFDLNKLKRRGFRWSYPPEAGIVDVRVKKLRFAGIGGLKDRTTLEADPTKGRDAIYDQIERTFVTDGQPEYDRGNKLPLSLMNITQAGIVVEFARRKGIRGRPTRTFDVSYPNACPLGHDGADAVIRQMLVASGIERASAVQPAA
jgi:hypothetical protein